MSNLSIFPRVKKLPMPELVNKFEKDGRKFKDFIEGNHKLRQIQEPNNATYYCTMTKDNKVIEMGEHVGDARYVLTKRPSGGYNEVKVDGDNRFVSKYDAKGNLYELQEGKAFGPQTVVKADGSVKEMSSIEADLRDLRL